MHAGTDDYSKYTDCILAAPSKIKDYWIGLHSTYTGVTLTGATE